MIEVPRESTRIAGSESEVAEPAVGGCAEGIEMEGKARLRAAGTMSEEEATTISDAIVLAAVALNLQSCL